MPLHDKAQRVRMGDHHPALVYGRGVRAAPEAGDLEHGRDGERAELAVELEDGLVRRRLRAERLIVHDAHALRGEPVFPGVDWNGRKFLFCFSPNVLELEFVPRYSVYFRYLFVIFIKVWRFGKKEKGKGKSVQGSNQ